MNTLQLVRPSAHVAEVWLNRPDVRNAFNDSVIAELTTAFQDLSKDNDLRAIVLSTCPVQVDGIQHLALNVGHATECFEARWVKVGGQYMGALSGQRQSTGPTDPLACCRDQSGFSC
jgi:hypothetical protein